MNIEDLEGMDASEDCTVRSEVFSRELQGEPEEPQPTESKDDAEARRDFGLFKVTSFIAITRKLEFDSMCRKKKQSLSHWSTFT